jgi:hypothetical protein
MKFMRSMLCLPFVLAACGGDEETPKTYDEALLAEYRAALPSRSQLEASEPADAAQTPGDAMYPNFMSNGVQQVNGMVLGILGVLDLLKTVPPTVFNSETEEFVWGPWDNNDGYGQVLAYVAKAPEEADFEYHYAFARLENSDMASLGIVIFGGATPLGPDRGVGLTMWDFEANNAWEAEHDPDYDAAAQRTVGRFLALYGSVDPAEGGHFEFVGSVLRNFRGEEDAGPATADLDMYYGRGTGPDGNSVSFLDWQLTSNVCSADNACFDDATPGSPQDELTRVRLAFLNNGMGRAEATVSGGDLSVEITAVECWDQTIESRYLHFSDGTNTYYPNPAHNNMDAGCGSIFSQTLTDLHIPEIDKGSDAWIGMDCAGEYGLGAPECSSGG